MPPATPTVNWTELVGPGTFCHWNANEIELLISNRKSLWAIHAILNVFAINVMTGTVFLDFPTHTYTLSRRSSRHPFSTGCKIGTQTNFVGNVARYFWHDSARECKENAILYGLYTPYIYICIYICVIYICPSLYAYIYKAYDISVSVTPIESTSTDNFCA